jgi:hypothetical protein
MTRSGDSSDRAERRVKVKQRLPLVISLVALGISVLGFTPLAEGHGVFHAMFAHDAGQVDGKSAVAAGATLQEARGKLVATRLRGPDAGKIPKRFIPKVDRATTANHANTAGRAASAADADSVDGLDSTAFPIILWAGVDQSGVLRGSRNGAVSVTRTSAGNYIVTFDRPVANCARIPALGGADQEVDPPFNGEISTSPTPMFPGSSVSGDVLVHTFDSAGVLEDKSFRLAVLCHRQ